MVRSPLDLKMESWTWRQRAHSSTNGAIADESYSAAVRRETAQGADLVSAWSARGTVGQSPLRVTLWSRRHLPGKRPAEGRPRTTPADPSGQVRRGRLMAQRNGVAAS